MKISNSFSDGEISLLDYTLKTLLEGHTPVMTTRHKDFPSLYRKVYAMKKQLEQKQRQEVDDGKRSV